MGGGNWDEQLYPASQMPDSALCAENRINKTIQNYSKRRTRLLQN